MIKEACVESFEKALEAQNNGANRIELCENLAVGGTTPSYGTVKVRYPYFSYDKSKRWKFYLFKR